MAVFRTVMVSSTARDLPKHREQVEHACLARHALPLMMEHLPATSADAKRVSAEMVDRCDVYVGVFGHRYGFVPSDGEISVTELEYLRAVERGIPRLIFVMADEHPITAGDVEKGAGAPRLEALKSRLLAEQCVRFFDSPAALRAEVLNALASLDEAAPTPTPARSDLSISSLGSAWRVRPLNGHPLLDSPLGPVHGGGARVSFTLAHNGQGYQPIHLHVLTLELLEHRSGVDPALQYRIDGAAIVGAGVARPHVFSIALRGEQVGPARWAGDAAPAASSNLLDTEPPRVLAFKPRGDDIEELQGTITARIAGWYRLRFAFHYSVAGDDRCQHSDELRIYAQGQ